MLPSKFQWIETIGTLPKLVAAALQYLGIKEIPGIKSNPVILDMAKGLGLEKIYTNDDTSWCAVFINHLLRITGKPINLNPKDKYDLLRAKKTAQNFQLIAKEDVRLGDIVIMDREGGGHVCLYIAKVKFKNNFWGLGGNQSNSVTFSEFDWGRVKEVRRYYATGMPASAKQYEMDSSGKLSTNEA